MSDLRRKPPPNPERPRLCPDGDIRTERQQQELDRLFARTFAGDDPAGERVLEYLRHITIERVMSPGCSDAELRHLEGARGLYAIIRNAVDRGRKG